VDQRSHRAASRPALTVPPRVGLGRPVQGHGAGDRPRKYKNLPWCPVPVITGYRTAVGLFL